MHVLHNREVLTCSFADRELNHYLLKWDSLHQASTILNVGVKIQLVLQDFFCSPQYHYLHHVIQSHLQQLLKRGEMNSTFKLLLSLYYLQREPVQLPETPSFWITLLT